MIPTNDGKYTPETEYPWDHGCTRSPDPSVTVTIRGSFDSCPNREWMTRDSYAPQHSEEEAGPLTFWKDDCFLQSTHWGLQLLLKHLSLISAYFKGHWLQL